MSETVCTEGVTRKGEFQPCEKPAVGIRIDPEWGTPYPVCPYHCRGDMVSLDKVKADALREAATGLIDWDVLYGHEIGTVEQRESNRNAQWLTSEADRIEKEASNDSR